MDSRNRMSPGSIALLALALASALGTRSSAEQAGTSDPVSMPSTPTVWSSSNKVASDSSVVAVQAQQPAPAQPQPSRMGDRLADREAPPEIELDFALDPYGEPDVYAPNMLGDRFGVFYIGPPPAPDLNVLKTSEEIAVYKSLIRFSAADNRSARPQNRIWYSYNSFDNAFNSPLDMQRHTWGAEMMFLRQRMSFEVLAHTNFYDNATLVDDMEFGDMATILKGILYQDIGMLFSWGLGTTWPTGDRPSNIPGETIILSPFMGYLFAFPDSRWFVQGFEELDILFREDRLLLQSDIGVGYWIKRYDPSQAIAGIAPTTEVHIYTPISTGDESQAAKGTLGNLDYFDVVNLTLGATVMIFDKATIAAGFGIPLTDNRDYDLEAMLHLNWRFGARRL